MTTIANRSGLSTFCRVSGSYDEPSAQKVDMPEIQESILIERGAQTVFDFVTTPATWPTWHPASVAVPDASLRPVGVGAEISEIIKVIGPRDRLEWRVVESEPPHRWVFEGGSRRSGRATITYTLTPGDSATLFHRRLEYTAPNRVMAVMEALFARRRMVAQSRQALERLKLILETAR